MIRIINFFFILFLIVSISKAKSPEEMIKESIANYPGKCPCPYSIMSNGKKCGKRSAYSKPGGYEPLCYVSDITGTKNNTVRIQEKIRIIDGDTIHINKIKYRLHGIDAPEIKQLCKIKEKNYKCGVKSKEFLGSLIGNQSVKCNHKDKDRRNRYIWRHMKDTRTGDPTRAGYLSLYVLCNDSSSLYCDVKPHFEATFTNNIYFPLNILRFMFFPSILLILISYIFS